MIIQRLSLDLVPNGTPPTVKVSQYDDKSREFIISIYHEGTPFYLDDTYTVIVKGTKPNGKAFEIKDEDVTIEDGNIVFKIKKVMTTHRGIVKCGVQITKDDEVISPLNFFMSVAEAAMKEGTELDVIDDESGDEPTDPTDDPTIDPSDPTDDPTTDPDDPTVDPGESTDNPTQEPDPDGQTDGTEESGGEP